MEPLDVIAAYVVNFLKQVEVDALKKPGYALNAQYQNLVADMNAFHDTAVFPSGYTAGAASSDVGDQLNTGIGWTSLGQMIENAVNEGSWDAWPIVNTIPA